MNAHKTIGVTIAAVLALGAGTVQAEDRPPPRRVRPERTFRAPPPPPRHVPSPPHVHVVPARPVYVPPPAYHVPPPPPPPVAVVHPAPARPSLAPVLYLGVGGNAGVVAGGVGSLREAGGGFDAFVGVELGRHAGIELDWTSSFRSGDGRRSAIHSVSAEGKVFLLPSGSSVRPYAAIGLGAFLVIPDLDHRRIAGGPGVTASVGADILLGSHLFIGAKVGWRGVYMDDAPAIGIHDRPTAFLNDLSGTIRMGARF